MAREKEADNNFMIGDVVKHKSGIQGRIHNFEHSGVWRAAVENGTSKGFYIISIHELELVSRPEREDG
jgi:hypothetical protein